MLKIYFFTVLAIGGFGVEAVNKFGPLGKDYDGKLCEAYGDTHIIGFDGGRRLNFQGQCTYLLARDHCNHHGVAKDGAPRFECWADFWDEDMGMSSRGVVPGWVKSITCNIGHNEVFFGQRTDKWDIRVNGRRIFGFPYHHADGLVIGTTTTEAYLETTLGLMVFWNGVNRANIGLPKHYHSGTCGLCGVMDGDDTNDWVFGPAYKIEGQVAVDRHAFGHSWLYALDDDDFCQHPSKTDECGHVDLRRAKARCKFFKNVEHGAPLRDCLRELTWSEVTRLMGGCIYDACVSGPEQACVQLQNLVKHCMTEYNINVRGWVEYYGCQGSTN